MFLPSQIVANDVTGDFSNNYQDSNVDSNNETVNQTTNNNATGAGEPAPVMSAIAPTIMGAGGNDSCLLPTTSGLQVSLFGYSQGTMTQDEYCNRRKNARLLGTPQQIGGLGLQVSAISVICNDPNVFRAMMLASTPCPIMDVVTGKILMGKSAVDKYRENPTVFIVGYKDNEAFWDSLLKIGEDLTDEINETKVVTNGGDTRSLSERFRSTRRVQSNRTTEDNGAKGDY
ncbi:hypothetical protein N9Z55_06525 [Akkermansiaceae bacterium]|nr:hypothetical protein [Akkermansiaceae bacterium]